MRIRTFSTSIVALAAGLAFATPALAEDRSSPTTPDAPLQHVRAIDTIQAGEGRNFQLVLDAYVPPTNWLPQILGGKAVIDAKVDNDAYRIDSRITAAGIIDWFVDYSSTLLSRGELTTDGIRPMLYTADDDEGRKNRTTRVQHLDDAVEVEVVPGYSNLGDPAPTMEDKLEAMDPMSALLNLAMNPDATAEDPCSSVVKVYDGKSRYNLHLSLAHHMDKFDAPGWKGPTFICNVRYEEVAGFKKKSAEELAAQQRDLKWINIALADLGPGEARVPVKIEARSKKRGKVTLVARKFEYGQMDVEHADITPPDTSPRG